MIFRITEPATSFTLGVWGILFAAYIVRTEYVNNNTTKKTLNGIIVFWLVFWIGWLGYDQYRLQRAHNFSIPSNELSDVELEYRETEINRQKEQLNEENKADELDKLIEEIQTKKGK